MYIFLNRAHFVILYYRKKIKSGYKDEKGIINDLMVPAKAQRLNPHNKAQL